MSFLKRLFGSRQPWKQRLEARGAFGLALLLGLLLSQNAALAQTVNWTKYDNTVPANSDGSSTNGKIPLGTAGKGDTNGVTDPFVLKEGSTYKMWYSGQIWGAGGSYRIYYATSPNGLEWTKYDNTTPAVSDSVSTNGRIPLGNAGKGDATHASIKFVLQDGSTYKMWYSGWGGTPGRYSIYYATSTNGLTWTKLDNNVPADS
ncbi:MAG: hypothetical protein HYV35_06420, partial [Lentisphaerae bacterium]|nr:hypothetical protein [Lentisphaerota bacterium]